ncbi:hypothetical protein F2Q70_00007149 [Brassica cretica]|uniref:Uncharacterized protein n=1 Tax=Brassica cretica TaxID=69181 RepID=A0A8S9M9I1_BRACR|nr:hypothetical protein F2Q70_00007149 [Brassica cretica]
MVPKGTIEAASSAERLECGLENASSYFKFQILALEIPQGYQHVLCVPAHALKNGNNDETESGEEEERSG